MKPAEERDGVATTGPIRSGLWFILLNVFIPIVTSVIGLTVEYWSGWFIQPPDAAMPVTNVFSWHKIAVTFIVGAMIAALFNITRCLGIWLRPYRHVREQFSLAVLLLNTSMLVLIFLSIITRTMPWEIHNAVRELIGYNPAAPPTIQWTDSGFLVLSYIIIAWKLKQIHQEWRGLKSIEQHRREQRNEHLGILGEGGFEIRRLLLREPPLKPYRESSPKDYIPQLEPVSDFQAWKDLAKDLVRLSSSSYAFETETAWHDLQGCWMGQNVNTGELVFLYPRPKDVTSAEVTELLKYAEHVATIHNRTVGEVIIAVREGSVTPSQSRTTPLIRYENENSLLNCLVDFKDYISHIRRRVLVERLPDSELVLNDTYVPSRFCLPDGSRSDQMVEEYLNEWANEPGHRQLALLGEYGQGKSTATLMWVYHLISARTGAKHTPLLIELRGTSPRNLTPLGLLGAWAGQYSINPQALLLLLKAGRLVLIFEGFDEMALVGDAEMRLKHFRTLWQFAYPRAKILITGRPNFFLDEDEMKAALGIGKPVGNRPYCEAVRLMPFRPDQIERALRVYAPSVRQRICELVKRNTRFYELVSRPSLLHIVAVLWERERLYEKIDQLTSAFVMDLFVRHSYRRQGLKEVGGPDFMALTSSEREYFMTGIAAYMVAKGLPNQISSSQLSDAIEQLLSTVPDSVTTDSSTITGEVTLPLRKRVEGTEYGVEHVQTDVRACGLLVDDPAAPGTFRFGHKSFMEYLFADVVAERIQDNRPERARAVLKATGSEIEQILRVPEAVDFLSEILMGNGVYGKAIGFADDEQMARHLFRVIMGEGPLKVMLNRPGALTEIGIHCVVRGWSGNRRVFARFLFEGLPVFLMSFIIFLTTRLSPLDGHREEYDKFFFGFVLTWTLMLTIKKTWSFRNRASLRFWSRICKELGVQDRTLHRVVGTGLIPKLSRIPFDYHNQIEVNDGFNKDSVVGMPESQDRKAGNGA